MTARAALREIKGFMEPIEIIMRSWVPKPPNWTDREVKLVSFNSLFCKFPLFSIVVCMETMDIMGKNQSFTITRYSTFIWSYFIRL